MLARSCCELSACCRAAVQNLGNGIEVPVEDLIEQEDGALAWCEPLQYQQESNLQILRHGDHVLGTWLRRVGMVYPGFRQPHAHVVFALFLRCAQTVKAQSRQRLSQEGTGLDDVGMHYLAPA
mgnify:CR=1 FL=1